KTAMRGGKMLTRLTLDVTAAAARLGVTPEVAELIAFRLQRAASGADADAVVRVSVALRVGGDIEPADLDRMAGVMRRLGASDELLSGSRWGRQSGLLQLESADEAARLGRRQPEVEQWYRGLNRETRDLLAGSPAIARAYEQMDPLVRRLLTRCASTCI